MAKSKHFELIFVFLVIFFQQFALAQDHPKTITANPSNPNIRARFNEAGEFEMLGFKLSPLDQRALAFLNRDNLREIDRIKWPDNPELEGPSKVKFQNLDNVKTASEKIKVSLQNCKKQTAQYESEVQASYDIKKGTIPDFDVICELLAVSIKGITVPNHPVFNVVGQFVMNKLDSALFRYLQSPDYERTKNYQKSILGRFGLPIKYMGAVLQVLVLLLLALNGFLVFKVLS